MPDLARLRSSAVSCVWMPGHQPHAAEPLGPVRRRALLALAGLAAFTGAAAGCEVPDEGNTPWRRAVAKVKYLPQTEAWSEAARRAKKSVQYVVSLDQAQHLGGRCYWPAKSASRADPGNGSWSHRRATWCARTGPRNSCD